MTGKRRLISNILFKTRLIRLIQLLYSHNHIVVLNYHRVRSRASYDSCDLCNFDDSLFDVDEKQFVRQMKWIKRHARILSETDLINLLYGPTSDHQLSKYPRVVITFDDGYRDNYTIAYPVLKSLEIPAFFFVCTSMIDNRCLGGWDILAYLLKKCEKPSITLNGKNYDLRSNQRHSLELIQTDMKAMPCEQLNEFIRSISDICEVELPSIDLQNNELLTWKNIEDMTSHHMTIGSHTHSHSVLTGMASDQHLKELMTSKQILEKRTGRPILSMAYPFGDPLYIPDTIQETALYASGCSRGPETSKCSHPDS